MPPRESFPAEDVAPRMEGNMNPAQLNSWLQMNGGYDDDNDMSEDRIPALAPGLVQWSESIGMHRSNDISLGSVARSLAMSQPVIANVMHGRHFVLVVGLSSAFVDEDDGVIDSISGGGNKTTLYVNDPGFYRNTYDFESDVVGWRLFNMTNNETAPPNVLDASSNVLRGRHRGPQ